MLDVDICGPSIPVMMGVEGHQVHSSIHLLIHPSPHPSIFSSIHLFPHLPILSSIPSFIHFFIPPSSHILFKPSFSPPFVFIHFLFILSISSLLYILYSITSILFLFIKLFISILSSIHQLFQFQTLQIHQSSQGWSPVVSLQIPFSSFLNFTFNHI